MKNKEKNCIGLKEKNGFGDIVLKKLIIKIAKLTKKLLAVEMLLDSQPVAMLLIICSFLQYWWFFCRCQALCPSLYLAKLLYMVAKSISATACPQHEAHPSAPPSLLWCHRSVMKKTLLLNMLPPPLSERLPNSILSSPPPTAAAEVAATSPRRYIDSNIPDSSLLFLFISSPISIINSLSVFHLIFHYSPPTHTYTHQN